MLLVFLIKYSYIKPKRCLHQPPDKLLNKINNLVLPVDVAYLRFTQLFCLKKQLVRISAFGLFGLWFTFAICSERALTANSKLVEVFGVGSCHLVVE